MFGTLSDFIIDCDPDPQGGYSVPSYRNTQLILNFSAPHLEIFNLSLFTDAFFDLAECLRYFMHRSPNLYNGETVALQDRGITSFSYIVDGALHINLCYTSGFSLERFAMVDFPYWTLIQQAVAEKLGLLGMNQTWELTFGNKLYSFGDLRGFKSLCGLPSGLPLGVEDWEAVCTGDVCPCPPGTIGAGLFSLFQVMNIFNADSRITDGCTLWNEKGYVIPFSQESHLGKLLVQELVKLQRARN